MTKITIQALRKTPFIELYKKLLLKHDLAEEEQEKLLEIAVILLNNQDIITQKLGYRIILLYSNYTGNYKPLYDVAINLGYIPIAKKIESMDKYQKDFEEGFFRAFLSSFKENFKDGKIYMTLQQLQLNNEFYKDSNVNGMVVVAPTSYGKSELIVSSLDKENGNICILVPTKALVAQTKRRILGSDKYSNTRKIVTHPEMFIEGDTEIIAVLTQERLLRLLLKEKSLSFELIFIDEAHNLLEEDDRARLLASAIILLSNRNPNSKWRFLTPFLVNYLNLKVNYANYSLEEFRINEYLKTEKLFCYDFKRDNQLKIYDHFMDKLVTVEANNFQTELGLITAKMGYKNIVYLNRPAEVERFSKSLTKVLPLVESEKIKKISNELMRYLHKEYFLVDCIKHGFVYHHGSMPDNVKVYIENMFSKELEMKFVITTSTLLEGVNIPADRLFLLSYKRGRGNLSASQFKNLIGRVCRFSEVFNVDEESLQRLEPHIYLIGSSYSGSRSNVENYIRDIMRIDKKIKEESNNVLLTECVVSDENVERKNEAIEYLENFEPGIISNSDVRYAQTEFGKSCYFNSVYEIDIIQYEEKCQKVVDEYRRKEYVAKSSNEIMNLFSEMFLPIIKEDKGYDNIKRLGEEKARAFYTMFLNWRMTTTSFGEMINSFLSFWKTLDAKNETTVFVGRKWGEITRNDGFVKLWVDISSKGHAERVNLAIVRIKEEQDFLDNELVKFFEVLNDVKLIEPKLYSELKYGTSEVEKIIFVKNGISLHLANLIKNKYSSFAKIYIDTNQIVIDPLIIDEMRKNEESDILIFEAGYSIGKIK